MNIDNDRVTAAVIGTGCGPVSMEEGARLAEAWIEDESNFADRILAVEAGFSVRLDELTWLIGVVDLICEDARGVYGREHKTTKEAGRSWNEGKWLDGIKSGHQIACYALALRAGEFYQKEILNEVQGLGSIYSPNAVMPIRIRVRAAVKTAIPQFWPADEADGWQEFNEPALEAVRNAFIVKAEAIRAARRRGVIPWQLTGSHCFAYGRFCDYHDSCRAYTWPEVGTGFDSDDPAARAALPFLPEEAKHEDAVILSASAYSDWSRCMELGRQNAQGANGEESMALQTGTVFHSAIACWYKQLQEYQNENRQTIATSI